MPALALVSVTIADYATLLSRAQTGDRIQIAFKNEKREALAQLLTRLAAYVTLAADGDEAIMVSSGFELAKEPGNRPPIGTPENFLVNFGLNTGEMVSSVARVMGARSYVHEYTPDPIGPDSEWNKQFTTRRKYTFAGLVPGQKYWFRVAAIGPREQIVYTHAQVSMAA
ncbi:fibronectin type III domain-containing protein [Paraflavitalea speifideaquila]|uniref:fibronectin type III domain-containing protein n=1 Tax=Paraflavitalea speifideaquila TaxID=3076558 RepID=UPI0028E85113|nr:fibronectin type III domain-containing protein [Paraflavitalea speifideiaquila]